MAADMICLVSLEGNAKALLRLFRKKSIIGENIFSQVVLFFRKHRGM